MRCWTMLLFCGPMLGAALAAESAPPPAFTQKPTAARAGDKVRIDFAVDRETDVAVFIEDTQGKVVRHPVAGVLGKNPPAPLKPGLAQSIEWDGKDDEGKPAAGGPFQVRVGLGLRASWGGTAFAEPGRDGPNAIYGIGGLCAAPDGRVYVQSGSPIWLRPQHNTIHVFRRDGAYERTIKPFGADLNEERLRATGAFVPEGGRLTPVVHNLHDINYYPASEAYSQQMALTPDGHLVMAVPGGDKGRASLAVIDRDGGSPCTPYVGPALAIGDQAKVSWHADRHLMDRPAPCLVASGDGKYVYFIGLGPLAYVQNQGMRAKNSHAVYRVKFPERGPVEIVFGDPATAGGDNAHLNDPWSIAFDRQGKLLVADRGNDRVAVINEGDGSFAGSFAVPSPRWVGVHSKTSVVYVHSGSDIVKFSGWKDAKEVGRLSLKPLSSVGNPWGGDSKLAFCFALDASADPAVLWIGRRALHGAYLAPSLLRCEDRGAGFSEPEPAKAYYHDARPKVLSTDPSRREVFNGGMILDDVTGQCRRQPAPNPRGGEGHTSRLGPNGRIYTMSNMGFGHGDRSGKTVPFAATANDPDLKGTLPVYPGGNTAWERDFGVDRQNNVYVKSRGAVYHGPHKVDKFSPEGKYLGTVLWCVSDGAFGPKIDPKGNLYIAESVKPLGVKWPKDFDGRVPLGGDTEHWYNWTYGSIVKFSPKGGAVWFPYEKGYGPPAYESDPVQHKDTYPWAGKHAFDREPKLDGLAKELVGWWRQTTHNPGNSMCIKIDKPATAQGAMWMHFGFAPMMDVHQGTICHCTATDFDIDDFGRVFYPDQYRFRTTVLDTNGNVVLHIGGYGNQDCRGPESYVLDPKEKYYRQPRPDDSKDLKSPFAEPEIAFNWITGMAATDRHLYVSDALNKRVLRVKLNYAATATITIP